jgi:hypothetical protein
MNFKTTIAIAAAILALFAMAMHNDAIGWGQWGPKWNNNQIPVPIEARSSGTGDCSGTSEFGALRRAGRTWITEPCSYFSFSVGSGHPNNRSAPTQDGVNNITWDYGYGGLAVTYLWGWLTRQECDIIFNEQYTWSCSGNPGFGQYDAETVGLHELGHILALDHTNVSAAVMYAYYQGVRRSLHQDDVDGLCTLYPAASSAPFIDVNVTGVGFFFRGSDGKDRFVFFHESSVLRSTGNAKPD